MSTLITGGRIIVAGDDITKTRPLPRDANGLAFYCG